MRDYRINQRKATERVKISVRHLARYFEGYRVPHIPMLKENNIPTLFLEFDVTVPIGQFKTRVEAFLEMIGEEDLF